MKENSTIGTSTGPSTMLNHFPENIFSIISEECLLIGDQTSNEPSSVLCLHGGGTSTRQFFKTIRKELWKQQIPSAAFDFVGHGETGGRLQSSSLKQRFHHSCEVIDFLKLSHPLSIMAASMSGYTAIKLLEKYEVRDLILFVPAVYHADANAIPFDQGFSEIIRKPKSWLETDAWKILERFKGNLLIIYAENDDVVPVEIVNRLYESANQANSRHLHLVQGAPHKILGFLTDNFTELQMVSNLIGKLLLSNVEEKGFAPV